jgi:S-adenosylmethionine decarboxylase
MAYQDALFQLGMDLTRSSTAQKEDHGETARHVARDVVPAPGDQSRLDEPRRTAEVGRFQDRLASGFAGSHLIVDLFGACRLDDADHIERTLRRCAELAGTEVRHAHMNAGSPHDGVSGFAAVVGGHISIHTHPETGTAALDILVRGEIKSARVVSALEQAFSAAKVVVRRHRRGAAQSAGAQPQRSRAKVRKAA